MDNAGISREHWKIVFISGMGFFTDAYDLFIIGVVMSLLKPLWHVARIEEALVESTALIASALGALLFGRVADMVGRKRIYGVEVLVAGRGRNSMRSFSAHLVADRIPFSSWRRHRRGLPRFGNDHERICWQSASWHARDIGIRDAGCRPDSRAPARCGGDCHRPVPRSRVENFRGLRCCTGDRGLHRPAASQRDCAVPQRGWPGGGPVGQAQARCAFRYEATLRLVLGWLSLFCGQQEPSHAARGGELRLVPDGFCILRQRRFESSGAVRTRW